MARHDTGDSGRGGGGRGGNGGAPIMQTGDFIYLTGPGSSPEGDRPFLDRLNLKTLATDRVFRSASGTYETVVAPLDDNMNRFLTRYESPTRAAQLLHAQQGHGVEAADHRISRLTAAIPRRGARAADL